MPHQIANHRLARQLLAQALLQDALAHEEGRYAGLATRFDELYNELLPLAHPFDRDISIVLHFWDGWGDASLHNWQYYSDIAQADWPRQARYLARALIEESPITDETILRHFAPRPCKSFTARLKGWLGLKREG